VPNLLQLPIFNDFKLYKIGDFVSLGNLAKGDVQEKADDLKKAFNLGIALGR